MEAAETQSQRFGSEEIGVGGGGVGGDGVGVGVAVGGGMAEERG